MAGSLMHIVDAETGRFRMDLIENLGDAHEALEDCFMIIHEMTGGSMEEVNGYCGDLGLSRIRHNMVLETDEVG